MRGVIAGATAATCACVWKQTGVSYANTAGEGIVHGARGINGGRDGAPHDYTLLAPNVRAAKPEKQGDQRRQCPQAA